MGVERNQVRVGHGARLDLPVGDDEVHLVFPHRRLELGRIAGVVTDKIDGRPGSRLPVTLSLDGAKKPLRQVETTTSGAFEFAFLRAGKYRVTVWGTQRQLAWARPPSNSDRTSAST